MPFTQHGLTKVNFQLHRMEITKLLHITFRFHCTDYRNCSVYTARNTIVPFTPHGLTKINFHLHRMETTNLHRTEFRNPSIYTARNTLVPFPLHGLSKIIFLLPRMEITTTSLVRKCLNIFPLSGVTQLLPLHIPGT